MPSTALVFQEHGTQVAVVTDDDRIHLKPIKVSQLMDQIVEVEEGISADDRIVNNPSAALLEGNKVRIVTPGIGLRPRQRKNKGFGSHGTKGTTNETSMTPRPYIHMDAQGRTAPAMPSWRGSSPLWNTKPVDGELAECAAGSRRHGRLTERSRSDMNSLREKALWILAIYLWVVYFGVTI